MSLRKPPTLTPARLEANRRNARKSTGPRTPRGKSHSRMNGLRTGGRSALYEDFFLTLLNAPPCEVAAAAQAELIPAFAAYPLFTDAVEIARQAEAEVAAEIREILHRWEAKKNSF